MFIFLSNSVMEYRVKQLKKSDLKLLDDLLETYDNLSPTPKISRQKANRVFDNMKKQGTVVLVAMEKKSKKIIGAITLLVEHKILRGGVVAGHIEDVVVRKGYEGLGIGSVLIKKAVEKAKKLGCYKIILDCDDNLVGYYGKFGFENNGSFMRVYL